MPGKLLVISDWDKRLTVYPNTLTVHAIDAPGDGYTSLILEKYIARIARRNVRVARTKSRPSKPPPPPPDITMSLLAGLPVGISPTDLQKAERVSRPMSIAELTTRLNAVPDNAQYLLIIDPP
jgi:hypothetical protein